MLSDNLKKLQDSQPIQKVDQGMCAKCGSTDVDYGHMELDAESVYYEMSCNDCGVSMHEWYDLTYSGTDVMSEDDDGGEIEFLQEGDTILDERGKDD